MGQILVNSFLNKNISHAYLVMIHNVEIHGSFQDYLKRKIMYVYIYIYTNSSFGGNTQFKSFE